MSWKKQFAARILLKDLPSIGAFKIESEPEPLGKGAYRTVLTLRQGGKRMLRTFESTIGDIVTANPDGWVEAYSVEVNGKTYINFRAVK